MMKKHFLLPLLVGSAGLFNACGLFDVAGGPGSETTNGRLDNGAPASFARVDLRKVDYVAASSDGDEAVYETHADSAGNFKLKVPEGGEYRLTVYHEGSSFTKIVTSTEVNGLDTIKLAASAVMKGEVDVPKGSDVVWVGIMGTDILVPSDANGVFVIPSVPANDSLQLYFVSEDFDKVMGNKDVFFEPSEFNYENYKSSVDMPKDSSDEEDSVQKVLLLNADGKPAVYTQVALRKADYRPEVNALQNNLVLADVVTDKDGMFAMEWPDSGSYRLTASFGDNSFSKVYEASDLSDIDTLKMKPSSTISSKVTLNSDDDFVWVGVYGLDVLVKTNEYGLYVLPAMPADESLSLYFIHAKDSVPFVEWDVKTPKEGTKSLQSVKLLYDFEEPDSTWYMDTDTLYKNTTFKFANGVNDTDHLLKNHLQYDDERDSKVFYTRYKLANDPYAWALVGTGMNELRNFSAIDSIEFYAKGLNGSSTEVGKVRVSLENWESYEKKASKAASSWIALSDEWKRYVVKPSDLCVNADEKYNCSDAWKSVKNAVKQLHFFMAGGNEIFIDDVKIYGALF